ncbi:MAG: SHOCT domain-containing protein [Anaerovoracaceae bacterium]
MGLFSNKSPCPVCGGKVSGLLPWKVEGEPVCGKCHDKVDLPDDMEKSITIEELKEYMVFYEENQVLKDKFVVSELLKFGFWNKKMVVDYENNMFCMNKVPDKTIFEGSLLQSFTIKEGRELLFKGSQEGLTRYESTVPKRVEEQREYISKAVRSKRFKNTLDVLSDRDNRNTVYDDIRVPTPFEDFDIRLNLDHPYWGVYEWDMAGPTFSNEYPDVDDYLREYEDDVEELEKLAKTLMKLAFPDAEETTVEAQSRGGSDKSGGDSIGEIKKYKALMEDGTITKEEFQAKKKELLGI